MPLLINSNGMMNKSLKKPPTCHLIGQGKGPKLQFMEGFVFMQDK